MFFRSIMAVALLAIPAMAQRQVADYNFAAKRPGGSLTSGTPATITLSSSIGGCPRGMHGDDSDASGTVDTAGTAVTLATGDSFKEIWETSGFTKIVIGGTVYTVSTRTDDSNLTLTSSAGTHSGLAYYHPVHWVRVSGGTGTAENVLITGGTCTPGAITGTIQFTPANNHSGAWQITSPTSGIQEAIADLPDHGGTSDATLLTLTPTGAISVSATISDMGKPVHLILGAGKYTSSATTAAFYSVGDGFHVSGAGIQSTAIMTSNATADIFLLEGRFHNLHDFTTGATVTRTDGSSFHMIHRPATNGSIQRVRVEGTFIGVYDQAGSNTYDDMQFGIPQISGGIETWDAMFYIGDPYSGAGSTVASTHISHIKGNFSTDIAEAAIVVEGGTDTLLMTQIEIAKSGGIGTIFVARNTLGGGYNDPRWIRCVECFFEAGASGGASGVSIQAGHDIRYESSYIATSVFGLSISGGSGITWQNGVITNIEKQGIVVDCDCDVHVQGGRIADVSQVSDGTWDSIQIGPSSSTSNVHITDVNFQSLLTSPTNKPAYNINATSNCNLNIFVIGNTFADYRTAGKTNSCTGGSVVFFNNSSDTGDALYNPVTVAGQLTSTVSTGTAPIHATSTTIDSNLHAHQACYNTSGTQLVGCKTVLYRTSLTTTIGIGGPSDSLGTSITGLPFTNSGSFECSVQTVTSGAAAPFGFVVSYDSGSQIHADVSAGTSITVSLRCDGI